MNNAFTNIPIAQKVIKSCDIITTCTKYITNIAVNAESDCATDTIENQNSNETEETSCDTGDNLGKLVDQCIL